MVEILLERPPPGRAQPVFRPRSAAGKRLLAQHVAGILEPARVHAQIPVRRARDGFQIGERQRLAGRERRQDRQPRPVVNDPIEPLRPRPRLPLARDITPIPS